MIGVVSFFYLLELQGDALLPWFLVVSRAEELANVDEWNAWMVIRVISILPDRVWFNDLPLKT
jgi:hypothetical protein